jgi:uncharacterized protein
MPAPVQPADRILLVDILRGFALLGILLVNMDLFSHPAQTIVLPLEPGIIWYDRAAVWLVRFLAEGKFYSLFSLLFGLGLTLQMARIEGRGARFAPLYARRLLVLLGIGLIHAFLIWIGDILTYYALLGFLLLLFRKARPRTLLIWAAILITLPLLLNLAFVVLLALGRSVPEGAVQIDQALAQQQSAFRAELDRAYQVYANGNFVEITAQRARDMAFLFGGTLFALGANILAMFLVGLYFGKQQVFQQIDEHRPFFRRLLAWGLGIGVIGNLIYATLIPSLARSEPSPLLLVALTGQALGAPALCLAYISAIALLTRRAEWMERLKILAPVGQMALSNYLTQSIVCTLIFYGYGLGLFGQVGTALGLVLAVAIFGAQIVISNWWMRRFRFGPAEWLWRSLTYGQPQPMRAEAN